MSGDFAALKAKLDLLAAEVAGKKAQARTKRVANLVKDEVAAAVRETSTKSGSLSDLKLGNFGGEMVARVVNAQNGAAIVPAGRAAGGPLRVLNDGRNTMQGPMISASGRTRRTKKGGIARQRRKRWNGQTKGTDVWARASEKVAAKAPALYSAEVSAAMGSIFGKG